MSQILIVGATGVLGKATTELFLKNNYAVTACVRDINKATDLQNAGATIVQADLTDIASLSNICANAQVVLASAHSMLGKGKNSHEAADDAGHKSLIDAAKKNGVQHFIYVSAYGAAAVHPVDFFRTKFRIEQYLAASGLNYTILRPTAFMEWHMHNLLGKGLIEKGKTMLFGKGENPTNFIAADDVAKLILHIYNKADYFNTIIEVSGADNLTKKQVAVLYAKYLNSKTKITHVPRAALKIFSGLLKPFHPGLSRVMRLSLHGDINDASMDGSTSIQRFGITPTRAEDFIKTQVQNAR